MPMDRAARLRLGAATLVAILLFAPRVRDVRSTDPQEPTSRNALARSLAPTGDQAVLDGARKPSPTKPWLVQRSVAERVWAAALLAAMLLMGVAKSQPGGDMPPRRLTTLLRRVTGRRAPPITVLH